ncbi:MAG TPA: AsmA family protein [Burkholderiales bacterium]
MLGAAGLEESRIMHTVARVALATLAVLLFLLLLAAALLRWFDWNAVKDGIAARVGDAVGTDVRIEGELDIDAGLQTIGVRIRGLRVAGSLPSPQPLLALRDLQLELAVAPLLRGDVVLRRLLITDPRLHLIRNEAGEVNWDFEKAPEKEEPPPALPVIEHLEVRGGRVTYVDAALREPIDLPLERIVGALPAQGAARLTGAARLESQPVRLDIEARPLDERLNFDIDGTVAIADGTLRITGTTARPDLELALHLPGSVKLGFVSVPAALRRADLALSARVTRDRSHWLAEGIDAALGAQRLTGDARLDADAVPPRLQATLRLNRLELPRQPQSRRRAPERRARGPKELIPSMPIELAPLRQLDARVDLRVGAVVNAPVPVRDLALVLTLEKGRLTVRPLSLAVAHGRIEGALEFDARPPVPVAIVRLTLGGLKVESAATGRQPAMTGQISGRIDLRSSGADIEKLLGNLDGQVLVVMREGSIRADLIEAIGVDLGELLLVAGQAEEQTPIRCAFMAFDAKDGVLRPQPVVLDTRDSAITLDGMINLSAETLDLTIRTFPKDASILSARGPIGISGSFASPSVDASTSAGRGAAALALGTLLGPLAALVPLVEPGVAQDENCRKLLADTPPKRMPRGAERGRQ